MTRAIILITLALTGLPVSGQSDRTQFDSLKELALLKDTPWMQASRMQELLWYVYHDEEVPYGAFPSLLDSLFLCCIKGKSGNQKQEWQLEARIAFFKASAILYDEPQVAGKFLETAERWSMAAGDSTLLALCKQQVCTVMSSFGDSLLFAKNYIEADRLSRYIHHPRDQFIFHCNIGLACFDFGLYADAVKHYFEALAIIDSVGSPELMEGKRDIYHNLAGVYNRLDDTDNALLYAQKAIGTAIEMGFDPSDHYTILAWIYIRKKDFSHAMEAYLKVDTNSIKVNGDIGVASFIYGIAACYRNLGRADTALVLARRAVNLLPISTNKHYGSAALHELAECEFANGFADSSLQHVLTAFETFSVASNNRGASESADLLVRIYTSLGQYEKALKYSELKYTYQQQVEKQQSNRQLAFGEFTRENATQQARREAEVKAELNRQRNIRYALFASLVFLVLLAFLLYNRYRFKQRTAIQLESARQRAEKSEAFKSRFLANMSHEIRTPLHGISGFAELLSDTSLTEKQRRWLGAIQQSSIRLKDVVNDILDLSKLEAREVTLRKVPFSLHQLVQNVAETLHPRAHEKGIELEVIYDSEIPIALSGDPTRLYQILVNLAGNAVKFTDAGKVTISVFNTASEDSGMAILLFRINDTGIGIPPEKLQSVFESFQQADDSTSAKFGGTGLGLTIARDLVKLHGSDIDVKSEVGVGSEFSFMIKLLLSKATELERTSTLQERIYDQYLRILVVDDNAFNREISMEVLHRYFENVEVDFAFNGLEATEKASGKDYDVVLMDMQMPEMNGIEATRQMRQMIGKKGGVPIVALTASAMPEEVQEALEAGMNRHLAKPFQPMELVSVIADVLNLDTAPDQKKEKAYAYDAVAMHALYGLNLSFLYDFCQGNEEQVQYFLGKFFNELPIEVDRMEEAFANGNREQVYQVAHSFRPQLDFVGLKEESAVLLEIEKGARHDEPMSELMERFQQIRTLRNVLLSKYQNMYFPNKQ